MINCCWFSSFLVSRCYIVMLCFNPFQMLTSNHTPSPCRPTTRVTVSTKLSLFRSTSSRLIWKSNFCTENNPHLRADPYWSCDGFIIASSNGTADKGAMTKVLVASDAVSWQCRGFTSAKYYSSPCTMHRTNNLAPAQPSPRRSEPGASLPIAPTISTTSPLSWIFQLMFGYLLRAGQTASLEQDTYDAISFVFDGKDRIGRCADIPAWKGIDESGPRDIG